MGLTPEIETPYSTPGLLPEWEFKLDFLFEDLEENLEISILRQKGTEETSYEMFKALIPLYELFPSNKDTLKQLYTGY